MAGSSPVRLRGAFHLPSKVYYNFIPFYHKLGTFSPFVCTSMWTLVILSVIAALLGIGVTVLYALRLSGITVFETLMDPSYTSTTYVAPDAPLLWDDEYLTQFELVSYENVSGSVLDDTYLGVYTRQELSSVADYITSSLNLLDADRVAVWVNESNPERIIGLYKARDSDDTNQYDFEIGTFLDAGYLGRTLHYDGNATSVLDIPDSWENTSSAPIKPALSLKPVKRCRSHSYKCRKYTHYFLRVRPVPLVSLLWWLEQVFRPHAPHHLAAA